MDFVIPPPPGAAPRNDVKSLEVTKTPDQILADMAFERAWKLVPNVPVHQCTCQRCPKVWFTLQPRPPKTCPACRSPWWTDPRTIHTKRAPDVEKKSFKIKEEKRGRKKGGKNKPKEPDAGARMEENGQSSQPLSGPQEIPEIPMEILGALGELTNPSPIPESGGEEDHAGAVSAEAPTDAGLPLPPDDPVIPDTGVETGQPAHDGGSPATPVDPLADLSDEEYWV